jgi:hypothetical protein
MSQQVEPSQQQYKENIASTANCPTANSQPSKKMNKRSKTLAKKVDEFLSEKLEFDTHKKNAYQWAVEQVVQNKCKTCAEA